ncbi:MAG: trigger factor [Thermomicrobiales bacterium]|nr:trigger factor [Thermomicrobiales bacterium]
MRVTVERIPGSSVELDIYADDVEFAEAYEKTLRKVSKGISIPGFRKGRAPRAIVEQMVGRDAIVDEAGRDMMDDLYRRAIEQEELVPVGDPRVGILQQEPIGFKVTIEVFPTVELGDYASVRVEPREVELEEDEVQQVLDQLQKTNSEWVSVSEPRSPRDDDKVIIDLDVYEGDEVFQEPATDQEFVIGETPLFDSLVESLKMMLPNTTGELSLAFDDEDMSVNPALRGKELRYVITLKDVQERILPELDDELAAKAGDFESVAALREQVEKDLLRNKAMEARGEIATEVINAMAEKATIEVPSSMIEKELDDELTQFRSRLAQQGIGIDDYLTTNDQTEDDLRDEMRPNAERRIRNSVVLQEIAKAENFEVSDDDINAEIKRLATGAENPERLESLYQSEYFRGLLENELFDRKLTERVIDIATEGRGAVTGSGAAALEAEFAAPEAAVEVTEVAADADESGVDAEQSEEAEVVEVADEADEAEAPADDAAADDEAEESADEDAAEVKE